MLLPQHVHTHYVREPGELERDCHEVSVDRNRGILVQNVLYSFNHQ
jgi:hypothetical protein